MGPTCLLKKFKSQANSSESTLLPPPPSPPHQVLQRAFRARPGRDPSSSNATTPFQTFLAHLGLPLILYYISTVTVCFDFHLTVETNWNNSSCVKQSFIDKPHLKPQDSLSTVMAFSYSCFWSIPNKKDSNTEFHLKSPVSFSVYRQFSSMMQLKKTIVYSF